MVGDIMEMILDRLLYLSKKAYDNGEIPVAAIIVKNNEIVAEGINTRHNSHNVFGHAEINAINEACKKNGDWRLDEYSIYVTLLPCMMCTGAIVESRLKKVYYLCNRTNVCFNANEYVNCEKIANSEYSDKYLKLLQLFFENRRK